MQYDESTQAVTNGDGPRAEALTREALDRWSDPEEILGSGLIAAMEIVGHRFSAGELS
jgi:methanogenic corrinoid protein MtbC1